MSPWTKFIDGKNREDTTPLLPDSEPPNLYRGGDASASAAGSASPADEYPDPVKPGRETEHTSFNGYPVWLPLCHGMHQDEICWPPGQSSRAPPIQLPCTSGIEAVVHAFKETAVHLCRQLAWSLLQYTLLETL